jgi:predicted double-glycine peptidase
MTAWLECLAVTGFAVLAFVLGRLLSRLPKPYWLAAYFIPLALILLYSAAIFEPQLTLVPPLSWLLIGRSKIVCFNFIATMLLTAPLTRLPLTRHRVSIYLLLFVLTSFSLLPFAAPAFNYRQLAALKTRIDADGVCHQSKEYTCGPAAAVTALHKLGINAEESDIAILAHTSAFTGTDTDVLARELRKRYAADGLKVEHRSFASIEELKNAGVTIAVLKFSTMLDHCVAVFGVETNLVIVGDPLVGLTRVPIHEFEDKWQFVGIVLKRKN